MLTRCIKLTIKKCLEFSDTDFSEKLYHLRYKTCKACNKAIQMYYLYAIENIEHKQTTGSFINTKERYGKTYGAYVETILKSIMDTANTKNVAQTRQFVEKKWASDQKDVLSLKKSIPNFKLDIPINIHTESFKIQETTNGYFIQCGLFNRTYQKENNVTRLNLRIGRIDRIKKSVLDNLISGSYKKGNAQIVEDKKGKWYIIISFSYEAKPKQLNNSRILGIALGIFNIVTMQIRDENKKEWDRLSAKECIIHGTELAHFRQKTVARMRELLISSKLVGNGKIGHGMRARTKSVDSLKEKITNFRDTINHKYSRYIIDFAVKHNCGIIQLEEFNGYNTKEDLLKNWSYYDLQQKIIYKANEVGIIVLKINPYKTSQRCSKCGYINLDNTNCKKNLLQFKCISCGATENEDINAAKNLSILGIDKIIMRSEV